MPLADQFHKPLITVQTRTEIINHLWPRSPTTRLQQADLDWDAYFDYYVRQCTRALHNQGRHIWARTHEDIASIAKLLEAGARKTT